VSHQNPSASRGKTAHDGSTPLGREDPVSAGPHARPHMSEPLPSKGSLVLQQLVERRSADLRCLSYRGFGGSGLMRRSCSLTNCRHRLCGFVPRLVSAVAEDCKIAEQVWGLVHKGQCKALDKGREGCKVLCMEPMQTTSTHRRETGRKEGLMASTFSTSTAVETEVREFAREFPTANVLRAVALCEAGTLTWAQVHEIFKDALAQGLTAVAS
jgi:hypothetical protein